MPRLPKAPQAPSMAPLTPDMAFMDLINLLHLSHSQAESSVWLPFLHQVRKNPKWVPPSTQTIGDVLVRQRYLESVAYLKHQFQDCDYLSVTTDGWSKHSFYPFRSVTLRGITSKSVLVSCPIVCDPLLTEPYSRSRIAQWVGEFVDSTLTNLSLDKKKVGGLVVDNSDATRLIAHSLPDSCMKHVCVTHRLHETLRKAFQRGLDADSSMASLFTSAMAAVRLLRESPDFRAELTAKCLVDQGIPHASLELAPYPWESLLHDLESVLSIREPLTALLRDGGYVQLLLLAHPSAFPLIEHFAAPLNKFRSAAAMLRSATKPTLHHVVTIVLNLKSYLAAKCASDHVDNQVKAILQRILTELEAQFGSCSDVEKMAFVLNPLLKDPRDNSEWSIYYNEGVEALRQIAYQPVEPPPSLNKDDTLSLPPACLRSHHSASIDTELDYYTKTAPPASDFDLLAWWSVNAPLYPRLSSVAKRLLCIPASQFTTAKDMSLMKLICAERRASLDPDNEEWQLISQFLALRHYEASKDATPRTDYANKIYDPDLRQEVHTRKLVSRRSLKLPALAPDNDYASDDHYTSDEEDEPNYELSKIGTSSNLMRVVPRKSVNKLCQRTLPSVMLHPCMTKQLLKRMMMSRKRCHS